MRRSPGGSLSGGGFFKQESFLEFDYAQGRWTYRIDEIAGAGVTDNVIDLMMRNIQRLSSKTQRILTLASCIGNPFGLQTLAIVSEQTPEEVAYDLRGAINEGLILTSGDCGSRIADCGLEVGSAIRSAQAVARNPQSAIRDPQSYSFLHDRVQQAAYAQIPPERKQVVHLTVGRLLLERAEELLERARTNLDKATVHKLRCIQYENMARYADALAVARESLALFGVSFPDSAEEMRAALESEIESIQSLLGARSIESLIDLPVMTDPETRMVMSNLTDIWASAYLVGDPILARLISATMARLSLRHGNVEESAYGYVTHAITVGPAREDYESAYEFGRLALRVNERFNDSRRRAKIHQQFHAHVNLWRQPMETCIPYAREDCRSGLEAGDFLYAAYGAFTETWPAIVSTQDLAQFVRDYSPSLVLINELKATGFADSLKIILNWARALQGRTRAPL